MGTVELDIGVYRKMRIFFYFQKYESHHIMVIIKHYTMLISKPCGWVFLYFNHNINILYFPLKFCFFRQKGRLNSEKYTGTSFNFHTDTDPWLGRTQYLKCFCILVSMATRCKINVTGVCGPT